MQVKILFIFLILVEFHLPAQTLEQQIILLKSENDSLRLALQKCQSAPIQEFMQELGKSLESPKFGEHPQYSREELHQVLLPQIKAKSPENYTAALKVIAETNQFVQFCDTIKAELIQRTGGLNKETGQPLGGRDKKAPTQYLIQENQGAVLKLKIDLLRTIYLTTIENDPDYYPRIVLQVEPLPETSRVKSWEAFKFKDMPLAAIFPMLGKMQSDAKGSEAAVLQYLNR